MGSPPTGQQSLPIASKTISLLYRESQRVPSFGIRPRSLLSHFSEVISTLPTPVAVTRCGPAFQTEPAFNTWPRTTHKDQQRPLLISPRLGLLIRVNEGPYFSFPSFLYLAHELAAFNTLVLLSIRVTIRLLLQFPFLLLAFHSQGGLPYSR